MFKRQVNDILILIFVGAAHIVDSSDWSFQQAGIKAMDDGKV